LAVYFIYVGGAVRNNRLWGLIAVLIILSLTWISYAQDGEIITEVDGPALKITGINTATLPDATVTVNVVDSFGQYIPNLTVDDFNLTGNLAEHARIVRVENVTDDDLPISVVLVIDTSSSMSGSPIARARQAAIQFVDQLGEQDSVAIITFDSEINTVQDFTSNKTLLRQAIETFPIGGQTALYDGTAVGLVYALTAPHERRTVILLSDGAEYGGTSADGVIQPASDVSRAEVLRTTAISGAPIYTIGLGFGVDRSYLQEVATSTNAQFYESPSPDNLTDIYSQIAGQLRTQYILTLDAPLPNDGGEYDFSLQANTPYGLTNIDSARLRAPIPTPIIDLVSIPDGEIIEETAVPIRILADDHPLDVQFNILQTPNGVLDNVPLVFSGEGDHYTLNIRPRELLTGAYQTQVTVTDADGDQSTALLDFSIGALPTEFSVIGLPPDNVLQGIFTPDDALILGVDVVYSQSPIQRVVVERDGVVLGESAEAPFRVVIPVLETFYMAQGENNLSVIVETETRQDAVDVVLLTQVQLPPTPTPTATATPTPTFTPSPTLTPNIPATVQAHSFSIDSALGSLQAHSATQSAYAQATQIAQAQLDTQATAQAQFTRDAQARLDARATANAQATMDAQSTAQAQATLDFEATAIAQQTAFFEATLSAEIQATATYEANLSATQTYIAQATANTVNTADAQLLIDTIATLDAQGTATSQAMLSTAIAAQTQSAERVIQLTADAQATTDTVNALLREQTAQAELTQAVQLTLSAQATQDAPLTLEAQQALDAQATADAQVTLDAESTVVGQTLEAQATADSESTAIGATLAVQATADAQATATANAVTPTPTPTLTPEFTSTPVTLIEVEAPSSSTSFLAQIQPYMIQICGVAFVLALLIFLWLRNRKR
jgi:VWFA-related protein